MSFIKNLFGGGGDSSGAYQSKNVGKYEDEAYNAIKNKIKSPLTGAAGVRKATQGFDFNPINQAQAGFQYGAGSFSPAGAGSGSLFGGGSNGGNPSFAKLRNGSQQTDPNAGFNYTPRNAFNTTYKPSQFNFAQLPQQYADTAYEQGAKNVRRESAGNLEKLREQIGTRRPGLFATAAQNAQRGETENLANLAAQTNLERLRQNVELGKEQQLQQAGENLRGAQFGLGAEQANAEERFKNLQALGQLGQNKAQLESGLLENERNYGQKDIENLLALFQQAFGGTNQAAGVRAQNRASSLNFLGNAAQAAAGGGGG